MLTDFNKILRKFKNHKNNESDVAPTLQDEAFDSPASPGPKLGLSSLNIDDDLNGLELKHYAKKHHFSENEVYLRLLAEYCPFRNRNASPS